MFCVTAGRIYVFRNQALVTNINASGNDFITASSITGAMLDKLRFAQSADTMIWCMKIFRLRNLCAAPITTSGR